MGPLVLFQIMKDMQAYKRQWEEMSFNNLDPDELPPPAFTTEKLVYFIKKCPVVQRFPGRFNRRRKFVRPHQTKRLYDHNWLLEHIGDRFIAYGAREMLSFTRSSVRPRHGPVSAAVTSEELEAEPEQDLGDFLCAKSTGRKQETSATIFAALPHVMRASCALQQAKDDIFAALRALALSQLGWAYGYRHCLADRAWTRRLVKGCICDDDRNVLARISDFWMNRPDPEHSHNTGGGPHREDDIDEVSNDGEFGDAFCKLEKLERRVVYPDLMDTAHSMYTTANTRHSCIEIEFRINLSSELPVSWPRHMTALMDDIGPGKELGYRRGFNYFG